MDALQLGPLVVSAPRLVAGVGLLTLIVAAEVAARRAGARARGANWAWNAAGAVVVGARLGFVAENAPYFFGRPLEALMFWQGGFSPWWGVAAGTVVAAWSLGWRPRALLAALGPAVLALAAWLAVPALLTPVAEAARRLPDVTLTTLAGDQVSLADLSGGPLVVNSWATWCLPCRREIPQLARAAAENPEVTFLFVNQGEQRAAVEAFLTADPSRRALLAAHPGRVLLDRDMAVAARLGGVGLPTTYFFAPGGELLGTHVGEISGAALAGWVRRLKAAYSQTRPAPPPTGSSPAPSAAARSRALGWT